MAFRPGRRAARGGQAGGRANGGAGGGGALRPCEAAASARALREMALHARSNPNLGCWTMPASKGIPEPLLSYCLRCYKRGHYTQHEVLAKCLVVLVVWPAGEAGSTDWLFTHAIWPAKDAKPGQRRRAFIFRAIKPEFAREYSVHHPYRMVNSEGVWA